ncbi:MAG: DUF1549 domain-containing protein [Planctomycetota bacterium]|nr:DUF1549 domain-containing protein [Planctomycetota bacterium]
MSQPLFAHRDPQVVRRLARRVTRLIVVLIAVTLADRTVAASDDVRPVSFDDAILPVLTAKCGRCHGAETQKGQLALHSAKSLRAGGEGGPVLVAGKPEESRLIEVLEAGEMPPDGKNRLTADELASIKTWIQQGAKFTDSAEVDRVTQHEVIPILLLRCVVCHGGRRREADLDLRSRDGMLRGGKSGPSIVPGDPGASLLLKRLLAEEMPPRPKLTEAMVKPLEPAEFEVISRWIEQGAVEVALPPDLAGTADDPLVRPQDREFWSFQPPQRPKISEINDKSAARNTIDRFILARLDSLELKPSPPADSLTLLRRATFDLTGLPPTPEEIARFRTETENRTPAEQAAAYDLLIDRLLESPRYGERWGRHWLDVAGYADCEGRREQHLPRPDAWRYRDYVIRSFNADKPYDRFLQEQLAGDELADYTHAAEITQEIEDNLVATGFLRMAPDPTWANLTGFVPDRLEVIADSLDVLGSGVMGMTLKCCRCHSHKFDPLPQRDYYRIAAIFKGAYDEHNWLKPDTVGFGGALNAGLAARNLAVVTTTERNRWLEQIQAIDAEIATLKSQGNGADIQANPGAGGTETARAKTVRPVGQR